MKKNTGIHIGIGIIPILRDNLTIKVASSVVIITDSNVAKHWLSKVTEVISGKKIIVVCISAGESHKTIQTLEKIWKKMVLSGADRSSVVVTLGGGVVCDIGGLAAATFMRGIPVIHIPTTLLAQTDASIGGKTAIDFCGIKNSIGVFHKPTAVIIDVQTLETLPKSQLINGMAEIVKHAIIADTTFFNFLAKQKIVEMSSDVWIKIITKSVTIKQNIVESDVQERNGIRKQLNFGHTVGHALEALSLLTKRPLLHGEAVAIGMVAEAKMSRMAEHLSEVDERKITSILQKIGLPTMAVGYEVNSIMKYILKDKKNKGGAIMWSLPLTIGRVGTNMQLPLKIIRSGILAVTK